jgi:hypothetical protein
MFVLLANSATTSLQRLPDADDKKLQLLLTATFGEKLCNDFELVFNMSYCIFLDESV